MLCSAHSPGALALGSKLARRLTVHPGLTDIAWVKAVRAVTLPF